MSFRNDSTHQRNTHMKHNRKNPLLRLISPSSTRAAMGVFFASALMAVASNLTWDANGVAPTVTNGAGVWDTSSLQWWNGADTVAWTNGNTAIIGTNPVAGAGGSISLVDQVNIAVSGLQVADNGDSTNHTVALPASGTATLSVGAGGIAAADGLTIAAPVLLGADQSWSRNAGGNGALTVTGALDDNFVARSLNLSSSLGATTVGLILRGPGFHEGTTTINDGYFQIRHDAVGTSAITLNGTLGSAQRIQFVNAAGTGTSGTLVNPISVNAGKEGNFFIWGSFTTTVNQAIAGGDATSVIRKTDVGTLLLSANNTYSAQTIVDAGTLQLGSGGTTGAINSSAALAINGSGILSVNRSGNTNLSDVLPGSAGELLPIFGAADARLNYTGTSQADTLTVDQDLGSNLANGQLRVSSGTMTLASGVDLTMRSISVGHTTAASGNIGTLNVGTGVNVTLTPAATSVAAISLGDSGGNAGIMNVTGGSVITNSTAAGSIRVGHWAGTGSVLNISGGSLSTPNGRLAIGWDGEGTLNMTGGTINALAVSIDGNGAGPASVANLNGGDLRIGGNGMNTLGQGTINANGGKITCTAGNTLSVPRTMLSNGLTVAFDSATTNINITDNCVTSGSGPLTILNESSTGDKNYTINANSPSYSGAVSVPSGVRLQLQQPNALGTGTATIVNGSGAFLNSSTAAYPTNFHISGNGWTETAGLLGALRLQAATVSGNVTIGSGGARISAHNGSTGTITGNLTGSAALEINSTQTNNNGTITLAGNGSSFTGPITVPQGRLNISGSVGGNVSVIDGATLGGEGAIGGHLILGGSSPANWNVNPATAGALAVTGNVSITGVTPVSFSASPTATGTITLLTYGGTFTGTVSDLVIANEFSYRTANFADTGSAITLSLSNKNLSWTGSVDGLWDLGVSANWTDGAASAFYWADNVLFPDGASNTNITLAGGNLAPASITFPANATGYTLTASGANQITGTTSVVKTGTGLLTMAGANAYTGGTTLSKGETRVRTAGTLGTSTVTLGDANTGTNNVALYLDTNRVNFGTAVVVTNNGTGTMTLGSRSTVTGNGDNNQFTNITLQRDVIFDSNATDRTDYENIAGTGNIRVTGDGRTVFPNANTFVGNLTIATSADASGLQLGTNSAPFNAIPDASNVTVEAGGKLSLSYTANGTETISGLFGAGTVRNNGGNANTLIVGGNNGSGNFSGSIVNGSSPAVAFGLTKNGSGTQTLSGSASSYTGLTTINAGVLEVGVLANGGNNSSIGAATSNIIFGAPAATLRYIGSTAASTDRSFTLSSGVGGGATLEASGTGAWTIPAAIALNYGTVDQTRTLTLGGTGTAANAYAGTIANNGTGVTSLVKSGTGTWALTANNSFTGPLSITGGRLNLSFIGNGGVASQVGQSTRVGSNLVINGGTLAYTGINATTDRGFSTGANGGIIDIPADISLTFGGTSVGGNFAFGGTLTKKGAGSLILAFYNGGSSAPAATDLIIDEGVVNFSNANFNANPFGFNGMSIVVNSGGVLRAPLNDALGGDGSNFGNSLGQIQLLGGEYNLGGRQWLSVGTVGGLGRLVMQGGTVTGAGNLRANGGVGSFISSLASGTTSVIGCSGGMALDSGSMTLQVADGTAATDLRVTGPITSNANNTSVFTKLGSGVLELQGANTYTGSTLVDGGNVLISGGHVRNTSGITLGAGTLLEVNVSNVFTSAHSVAESATSAITINGGTLRFNAPGQNRLGNITLNGGTLTTNQGSGFGNGYDVYLGALSDASEATVSVTGTAASTINGTGVLRLGTNTIFDVADANPAGDDLTVSVGFRNQTLDQANAAGGFTKSGAGTMVLSGVSAHTGNTTVAAGQLTLGTSGELRFTPTTNGVSNKVTGAGSATFNGSFNIILAGANTTVGNQWTLVDVASKSFGGSFAVVGFTKSGTVHTFVDGANTWTFEETTGVLKLQATVTNGYDAWKTQITNGKDLRTDDADDDGLTNLQEFLFGTSPIAATGSLTTISTAGGNMTLTWLQRETGASYVLKESTTLTGWQNSDLVPAVDPSQTGVAADYDRWRVIIPMTADKEFFRIEATELP